MWKSGSGPKIPISSGFRHRVAVPLRLFSTNRDGVTEIMTECPVCGGDIAAGSDLVVGELISCAECGSELEVTGLEPLAFAEAPESEEDWGQ